MQTVIKNKQLAAQTKERNIPFFLNEQALYGLVLRIAGKVYAEAIQFKQVSPNKVGMDRYVISDLPNGKILIEATSGVAAATAFKWYIENRCNSYVGPLTKRLNFPETPPTVGTSYSNESICLYRYFLNYCTYGYTLVFWRWDKWENLIDWMMLAGYNLVLNPLGNESVWLSVLQKLGYTYEQAAEFISSPTVFPWQCMMNVTGWAGAAPREWYEKRLELSKKINERLRSFGAAVMLPGWSGMVPIDFEEHFPESKPLEQGLWCDMPRPAILLPSDLNFDRMAECYYQTQKELLGDGFNYFSTDPFHEGGDSSKVDLKKYAVGCLEHMRAVSDNPVWFLQGWQDNPLREMLRALSPANVLIGNLRSTDRFDGGGDNFADYPWLYCVVNNFGGQRVMRGNMNKMLNESLKVVADNQYSAVGIGIIPEGIENDEILYDIFADYAVSDRCYDSDEWLKDKLNIRYGGLTEQVFKAWQIIRDVVYSGDTEIIPRESALCTRPSLTVDMVSSYSSNKFSYDTEQLKKAFLFLMSDYDSMPDSEPLRLDMLDIARQIIANEAWKAVEGIQKSYLDRNAEQLEVFADQLMSCYDLQEELVKCDRHTLLGPWLETAKANGENAAQKAYFEFLARTILTLWGDREGAKGLRDYAAREWDGMLSDFYRPRWESYINILRRSLVTGGEPMEYSRYDAEYFFTTLSKTYPTQPYGDLRQALKQIEKVFSK